MCIDSAVISTQCDGSIIVMTQGVVTVKEGLDVKHQLEKSNCKILGVILNDAYGKNRKYNKKYYKKYEYSASGKRL